MNLRQIETGKKDMSSDICPVCHAGHKRPGKTTFTADLGYGVFVVREVPAQVCDLCGTDWIKDQTAATLEANVEQARRKHPTGEVTGWAVEIKAATHVTVFEAMAPEFSQMKSQKTP